MLPQMIRGLSRKDAEARASELLSYLGLGERLTHRPAELSGGEQQRVAIARAVANVPRLLLADEPTGNLDPRTSDHVFHALSQLIKASGLTVVLATHNMEIAAPHGPAGDDPRRPDRRDELRILATSNRVVYRAIQRRGCIGRTTGLTLEQTMNYVLCSFREEIMFRAVVEEAAALTSISLFSA